MSDEKMSYLFTCRTCGCMKGLVTDSEQALRRYADNIAEMLKEGLKMSREPLEVVVSTLWCECHKPPKLSL